MNLCFVIGKIVSEIDYKFILKSKNISIAIFKIQLNNNTILKVKAYDEIADECYRKIVKSNKIAIQGNLNSNFEIIINDFSIY